MTRRTDPVDAHPVLPTPPADFTAAAHQSRQTGAPMELVDAPIACYPPRPNRPHWRIVYRAPQRRETTAVDSVAALYKTVTEVRLRCARQINPLGYRVVPDMIDAWLDGRHAMGWTTRTPPSRDRATLAVAGRECAAVVAANIR